MWTKSTDADSDRVRARRGYAGFGVGILIAIAATAIHLALRGWRDLEDTMISWFALCPGVASYIEWARVPGTGGKLRWWPMRVRTRTLMLLVAYVAVVLALGVLTYPQSRRASIYHGRYTYSLSLAQSFRKTAIESEAAGSLRQQNAEQLRAGKIPEKLERAEKDFIQSIDQTPDPEVRRQLFFVTAEGEEQLAALHRRSLATISRLVEYHETIARKYRAAAARPLMRVEPDPPEPPMDFASAGGDGD
jgi:hypothetical protein